MVTLAEYIALAVAVLAILGEALHARRVRRVSRLAFGPTGAASAWTQAVPLLRVIAVTLLAWGLGQLYLLAPRAKRPLLLPEGGYRHLVIALDVSPSMQLNDAGPQGQQSRAHRAGDVVLSILERASLDQVRISVVAFYTTAKPVVVDTFDLEVVKNILNDLPLEMAFDTGKTSLIEGVKESVEVARNWQPASTTLLIVSDGDTVPDTGLPQMPRSISNVMVLGVGSPRTGTNIDGHLSRQDFSTLRQLAKRLRGEYQDVNEKHLPSKQIATLARYVPMRDVSGKGRRELALVAIGLGAFLLAGIPIALAFAGTSWQAGVRRSSSFSFRSREPQTT